MTDKNWDDQKIENLLNRVPDIQDYRSSSEILARLKADKRLPNTKRKKGNTKWVSGSVAVAALLLLSVLLPSMLRGSQSQMDKASEQMEMDQPMMKNTEGHDADAGVERSALSDDEAEGIEGAAAYSVNEVMASHILLPDELGGMHTFRIGLAIPADIIPVTFLIPEEQILADFPDGEPSSVELYNKYAEEIPEEDLGFEEYHPYQGELTVENDVVIHKVSEGNDFDTSSITLGMYSHSIDETFIDAKQFKTVDANGDLVEFESVGRPEIRELVQGKRPLPYYKYTMPSGQFYLLPYGESLSTVEEALYAMKVAPSHSVEVLVPEQITFDVRVVDGVSIVTFDEELDLLKMDQVDAMTMIEGFMLTAQNYDMLVKFENVIQDEFDKYDLTANLPEPAAVNPLYFAQG